MNRIFWYILFTIYYLPTTLGQHLDYSEIESLIKQHLPSNSEVGISVYNLSTDQYVYNYQAEKLSRPASTLKLVTAITALSNPIAPFETTLWIDGDLKGKTLYGNIYIVGGLDPEFSEPEMNQLISKFTELPIDTLVGNIFGDVSLKDSLYWGNGWAWDDNPGSYQPYISPLMYNKGKVEITAKPSIPGELAQLSAYPKSTYYTLDNQTVSNRKQAGNFKLTRGWLQDLNNIQAYGNVSRTQVKEINIANSAYFFIHSFCDKLIDCGIYIDGYYGIEEFKHTQTSQLIAQIHTPIDKVIKTMLKDSDNLNAEALLIQLGKLSKQKHLSTKDGLKKVEELLTHIQVQAEEYRIVDGSGLSPYNLISPQLLVKLLRFAYQDKALFNTLYQALPIAGIDGTLAYRMKNTSAYNRTKAKTGTISAVSGLSGYTTNSKGEILAFAILNQNILKQSQARRFQDAVCDLLSR